MAFTPTADRDTGEIFYGFKQDEAEYILNLMSYGDDEFPNFITYLIQAGHFFKPQQMIREILDGRTFIKYPSDVEYKWSLFVVYTSNMIFAKMEKIHSALFKQDTFDNVTNSYDTYKEECTAAEQETNPTKKSQMLQAAREKYELALETYMPINAPIVVEETAQRNIYFDNKKRMLYIDGKYYNTGFIKRSSDNE